jgi:hypothetical protein
MFVLRGGEGETFWERSREIGREKEGEIEERERGRRKGGQRGDHLPSSPYPPTPPSAMA